MTRRLWEIDVARTVAIGMMVAYHGAYDVWFLAPSIDIDPFSGGWRALQVATGSSFLFVVGLSFAVANARARARGGKGAALWLHHARRSGQVLGAAALVTVVTLVALGPDDYIRFGILHCIGVSVLIAPLLARLGVWNVALGIGVIVIGFWMRGVASGFPGAVAVGFDSGSAGVDHYPLFPWAGMVLVGMGVGSLLYPRGERVAPLARLASPEPRGGFPLGAPGRRALPVYLLHQPLLIALLTAVLLAFGVEIDPR